MHPAFDDRRLPRLDEITAGTDRLDAPAAQQFDRVEKRARASIHGVIAGHRDNVEPAIGQHRGHVRRQPPVRPAMRPQFAALGIDALDLREADVGIGERVARTFA